MKEDYFRSEEHIKNVLKAQIRATQVQSENKLKRIEEYNLNPIKCITCSQAIPYEKKSTSKFCSRSCSAKNGNLGRIRTEESKLKTSSISKKYYSEHGNPSKGKKWDASKLKWYEIICKICGKVSTVTWHKKHNKTCSKPECVIQATMTDRSYRNKHRKTVKYFCKSMNKDVTLESSWEVTLAEHLDKLSLEWIRPKHIKWTDSTGKKRYYFPDFYLPKHNLYLDPKNPYCMVLDAEKMSVVTAAGFNIIYGDINYVIDAVNKLAL